MARHCDVCGAELMNGLLCGSCGFRNRLFMRSGGLEVEHYKQGVSAAQNRLQSTRQDLPADQQKNESQQIKQQMSTVSNAKPQEKPSQDKLNSIGFYLVSVSFLLWVIGSMLWSRIAGVKFEQTAENAIGILAVFLSVFFLGIGLKVGDKVFAIIGGLCLGAFLIWLFWG